MSAFAGLLAQIVGVGAQAAGAYTQSQALRAQGDYQKQIADQNAATARLQAEDAIKRGERESHLIRMRTRQLRGSQRAAFAAQGVDVDTGSAADLQADTVALGALDAMTRQNNAYFEAWGFRSEAAAESHQGRMRQRAARSAARSTIATGGLGFVRDIGAAANEYEKKRPKNYGDQG